jgi:ribulose 1,5-bisphosphate synthetase/thiazole synthase
MNYDVLIVGADAAGLITLKKLCEDGFKAAILD